MQKQYPTKAQLIERAGKNAVQFFHVDADTARDHRASGNEQCTHAGWYYWTCVPGCLPDSDAFGPHASPLAALRAAYDAEFLNDADEVQ